MKLFSAIVLLVLLEGISSTHIPQYGLFSKPPVFASSQFSGRIVGGQEAVPHSIPYQVGLILGSSFCGGSLLNEKWVVTAAHCGKLSKKPEVILGAHEINGEEETQIRLLGSRVIIHEDYDSATLRNDIALIELNQSVPINEYINTISLPDSSESYVGKTAQASGWGIVYDGGVSIAPTLRYVRAEILDNVICQRQLGAGIAVFDSVICLDGSDKKGICSGDSGGPLVDVDSNTLIGLTSYTIGLGCEKGYPSAFTRISSYVDWIRQKIAE